MGKAKNENFVCVLIMVKMCSNEPKMNLNDIKITLNNNFVLLSATLTSEAYFMLNWVCVCVFGSIGHNQPIQF